MIKWYSASEFPENTPIVIASHPRSGTHLTIDLLRWQFKECNSWKLPLERNDRLYCNIDELNGDAQILKNERAIALLNRITYPIIKTHSWPNLKKGFFKSHKGLYMPEWQSYLSKRAKFIYVWRDIKPVLCSYYLFCIGAGMVNSSVTISEFIKQPDNEGRSRVKRWKDHKDEWNAKANILCISYEEIVNDQKVTILKLQEFLNLPAMMKTPYLPRMFSSIWDSRKTRLFGIKPASTAIINQKKLSWKSVFNEDDLFFINEELKY